MLQNKSSDALIAKLEFMFARKLLCEAYSEVFYTREIDRVGHAFAVLNGVTYHRKIGWK